MNLRYKIIEIEKATGLAGKIEILNDPRPIGEILLLKIKVIRGAEAFGVESDTFAWLLASGYYLVIVREDDPDFNFEMQIDLATTRTRETRQINIEDRMTCRENGLGEKFRKAGMAPKPPGMGLPLGGMGGRLVKEKNFKDAPVFIPPPFPCLEGVTAGLREDLLDQWFRGIRDILSELKARHDSISVVFETGGDVVIPEWFLEWCFSENIEILMSRSLFGT